MGKIESEKNRLMRTEGSSGSGAHDNLKKKQSPSERRGGRREAGMWEHRGKVKSVSETNRETREETDIKDAALQCTTCIKESLAVIETGCKMLP